MVTDILVSASGSIWTLQGNTGPGLEWLWRNTGLVAGRFRMTLEATAAKNLCAQAQKGGLLTGAATYY